MPKRRATVLRLHDLESLEFAEKMGSMAYKIVPLGKQS